MGRYIVQHRRGSTSQWAENSTIKPKEGEIVIEIDEENLLHKLKIGDGIHSYAELAYLQAGDEVVTQTLTKVLPRIVTVSLDKNAWESVQYNGNPNVACYKQTIPVDGVTSRTKFNLQPDASMLAEFQKLNLVFVAENEIDGTTNENEITVYSVGDKPTKTYIMQATIVEADIQGNTDKVVGIPVGTPIPQSDWNQIDEAKGDYIKNKPIENGEGENSIEGQGASALADYGIAFGDGSIAGCKGYYIKSIDMENKKIYLTDTKVLPTIDMADNTDITFETPAYKIGAQFSIINGTNYILCGTITAISNNVITYEGDLGFTQIEEDTAVDGHTLSVPSQPEVGIVSIAMMSISLGQNNKSATNYGFVVGRDNVLAGGYGAITGRDNIAAYGATADGVSNKAKGQFSHTSGTKNTITANGWGGFTHGANNEIDASFGVALGRNLKVQSSHQTVLGRYNVPDARNNYLEILGNGVSDTQRSNAYTIDKYGNARFEGKVYIDSEDGFGEGKELATADSLQQFVTKDYIEKQLSITPTVMRCQRDDNLYSATRDSYMVTTAEENGIVYANIEVVNNSAILLMDYYGIGNSKDFLIKNDTIYFKILMRTNQQVSPVIYVYRYYDNDGNLLSGNVVGQDSVKGTGEWEEIIIKTTGFPAGAVKASQIHLRFAGNKKGSDYFDADGNLIGEPYFDVAGWAAFTDLALAEAYDFKSELLGLGSLKMEDICIESYGKASNDLSNVDNDIFKIKANKAGVATETYVNDKIASMVGSAPETLNTLNELAQALGNDENFATTILTQLNNKSSEDHTHTHNDISDWNDNFLLISNMYNELYQVKADINLSNIDNITFKAKIEDSGFKAGIPIIGKSNYCTYVVDEETVYLTDQLDRAFADGYNVVYLEKNNYSLKPNSHKYVLPEGNFTIIGLGYVDPSILSFIEPEVTDEKQWIYNFENITIRGYKASYAEEEQDGETIILSHGSDFYNCSIAYPNEFDLINSNFQNCEFEFGNMAMEEMYNIPMESVRYAGCNFNIDKWAIIGLTNMTGCNVRLRNMTSGAIPSDTIQFKTTDSATINQTTFYIGNPNCIAISNGDIFVSECNFPYYVFTSDTATIDETSCFINPATT